MKSPRLTVHARPLLAILFMVCLVMGGCKSDPRGEDNSFPNGENDAGADIDGGADATDGGGDPTVPPPVEFVLRNETSQPLYYQTIWPGPVAWLSVHDGEGSLQISTSCLDCLCPMDECVLCDAWPTPVADELEAGDEVSHSWDGMRYVRNAADSGCLEPVQMTDEVLAVEICYGVDFEEVEIGSEVVDPTCEVVEFQLGVDEEGVVTVE